jgi:hypothetical protein
MQNFELKTARTSKRRWIVERVIGRLIFHCRFALVYETLPESSAAVIAIDRRNKMKGANRATLAFADFEYCDNITD